MSKPQGDKVVELQAQGWTPFVPTPATPGGPVKMVKDGQTCFVMPDGTITTSEK